MLEGIRKKWAYKVHIPLDYNEALKAAYSTPSVVGGEIIGKRVLITGATGGIGMALSCRFLAEGCSILLAGRNQGKLKKAVEDLLKLYPEGDIGWVFLDLEDSDSILTLEALTVDVLVNNAGVFTEVDTKRKFRTVLPKQYHNIWGTNFEGTYAVSQSVIRSMLRQKREGRIINIASICAFDKKYQYTPYGMSKAAIVKMTEQLALKHREDNIFISGIAPGSVATSMGNLGVGSNIAAGCNQLQHVALPEEIAALAAYLAGPTGKYHNGQTIVASACEVL